VFGAGGGTSSYREVEETDFLVLWGANARENHPIFFHHVLRGVHHGARLVVVDPRRTASAAWADAWLGVQVGTDIALAHAMGREIIAAGLANEAFIRHATSGFDEYRACVEPWTLDAAARETVVPAAVIRDVAHAYASADRAIICWTLGITEHHNAVDNVLALINLALLTGHVGRFGSGLNPLRGQNNVQGGGDMGAIPNRLPGFQDVLEPEVRARFERAWGVALEPKHGWNLTEMFRAMERGALRGLFVIGENPAQSEADAHHSTALLEGLDHLVVQDIFLTETARLADVVLPATASWCEAEGTVTNSERRVQRCRKALDAPGDARDELWIIAELARRLGHDFGTPTGESVWNDVRAVAPEMFGGMSYARLEALGGIQWPCPDEAHPGSPFLHGRLWAHGRLWDDQGRLWEEPRIGRRAPFSPVAHALPVERPDAEYPLTLTTGRRLDSFNTGVQTADYGSPLRRSESLDLSPEDAQGLGGRDGEPVRVTSRRGSVVAPARVDPALRAGTVFMTMHFQDDVRTNVLTIDETDPKSGTAEFKACAVRVEPVGAAAAVAAATVAPR
jgi:predicted molibdopterin-dependent oxidoreductase YjgC